MRHHRVHIKREPGTGLPFALLQAAVKLNFDCWFVAPRLHILSYSNMPDHLKPHGIRFFTPVDLFHSLHHSDNGLMSPRGLFMEDIPRMVYGCNLTQAAIKFVEDAYMKADSRIVTIGQYKGMQ